MYRNFDKHDTIRSEGLLINHKKKHYELQVEKKLYVFLLDQMYRNFNKHDTNEDQIQEKHSV